MADGKERALRILHTSDWHLGIELGAQSRRSDHQAAIESITEIALDFEPDVIVHTGDLFDHARPGGDDQQLAADALVRFAEIAPTVVIGGNHDNSVVLDRVWGPLTRRAGEDRLTFRGLLRRPEDGGVIVVPSKDGTRRILVCGIPFVTSHHFARFDRPGETTGGFAAGIKRIYDTYERWLVENSDAATDKVVWAAHLLVNGAVAAGSERKIDMGDDYATSAQQIPPVSYAAFGHIHRAQALPGLGTGRYTGGMLHFRFDEAREGEPEKGIVLVELPTVGAPKIEVAPVDTGRRLLEITCRPDELASHASEAKNCYVRVMALVDGPVAGLRSRVDDALPGAIVVDVRVQLGDGVHVAPEAPAERTTIGEMLGRWLKENPVAARDPARAARTVQTMVEAAATGQRIALEDERLLDPDVAAELVAALSEGTGWTDLEEEARASEILASASAIATDDEEPE